MVEENRLFGFSNILVIMDNCSIHKTDLVKSRFWNSNIKLMYLPWYTPQWVPVENWFAMIKTKLRKGKLLETINLSLKKNYIHIYIIESSSGICLSLPGDPRMISGFLSIDYPISSQSPRNTPLIWIRNRLSLFSIFAISIRLC